VRKYAKDSGLIKIITFLSEKNAINKYGKKAKNGAVELTTK